MWFFYHDITSSTQNPHAATFAFVGLALLTGIIVIAPSYFDKKRK